MTRQEAIEYQEHKVESSMNRLHEMIVTALKNLKSTENGLDYQVVSTVQNVARDLLRMAETAEKEQNDLAFIKRVFRSVED